MAGALGTDFKLWERVRLVRWISGGSGCDGVWVESNVFSRLQICGPRDTSPSHAYEVVASDWW